MPYKAIVAKRFKVGDEKYSKDFHPLGALETDIEIIGNIYENPELLK